MSKKNRPIFASKTAFESLAVDSGEDTEDDVAPVVNLPHDNPHTHTGTHPAKTTPKKQTKATKPETKAPKKSTKSHLAESHLASILNLDDDEDDDEVVLVPPPGTFLNPVLVPDPDLAEPPFLPPHDPIESYTKSDFHTPHANGNQEEKEEKATTVEPDKPLNEPLTSSSSPATVDTTSEATSLRAKEEPAPRSVSGDRDAELTKKRQNMLTRTLWTFIMIGGFLGLLVLGHAYMVILVLICQTLVYREVTALFSLKNRMQGSEGAQTNGKDPWSKTLNWYFFAVTNYFLYGESIIYYFKHVVFADAQLLPFATNHRILSFTLYIIGFIGFVMSLKKGYLKQQFGLFCWVHMSLLLIVVSSHFIVNNILEGLIWFWVPASLVICNDVFAYIWGITLGRTPLIKLSPKKTVEGFVGAFWSTIVFALGWGMLFMRYGYMICPVRDLGVSAWSPVNCRPNPVFVWRDVEIWHPISVGLSTLLGQNVSTISYAPYQFHLLAMACFASLVAPFGGFFASGFKRAFNIKDFGSSIPGHGGMTDRMDCQFLMGVFTYVYYSSLIRENHVTVGGILQTIVSGLTVDEQLQLIADLRRYLEGQGIKVA